MQFFTEDKSLSYPAYIVYKAISEVEYYSEFLPWCSGSELISSDSEKKIYDLVINFNGIEKKYSSKVVDGKIETKSDNVNLEEYFVKASNVCVGILEHMQTDWRIVGDTQKSHIYFSVEFQLKSKMLDLIARNIFAITSKKIMHAFENRVKELYELQNKKILNFN